MNHDLRVTDEKRHTFSQNQLMIPPTIHISAPVIPVAPAMGSTIGAIGG
jgi:hypothetical protein